ncbi:MAG: geranylgeranylglycerol-phosphate geranylgeranyltransferase [Candidatus Thermoplasmatota archaeon]
MKLRDALALTRAGNAVMAGLGAVVGGVVAGGDPSTWARSPFAFLAVAFIAAFGNILNDIADQAIDRMAHPTRPLPSRRVSIKAAQNLLVACGSIGLVAAFLAGSYTLVAFAIVVLAALHSYETHLKARGLPGNLLVAALVAATFLFGAAATARPIELWGPVWFLAGLALLANVGREIQKDMQDVAADRGHRTTIPIQFGLRGAGLAALVSVSLANGVALGLAARPPSGWWAGFVFVLLLAVAHLAAGSLVGLRKPAKGQRLLKAGMAIALLAFLSGPLVPVLAARLS